MSQLPEERAIILHTRPNAATEQHLLDCSRLTRLRVARFVVEQQSAILDELSHSHLVEGTIVACVSRDDKHKMKTYLMSLILYGVSW